ncbi:MAG: fumarylacetoacetate hydrolase family protein [Ilumatobacteraceae bacterium]
MVDDDHYVDISSITQDIDGDFLSGLDVDAVDADVRAMVAAGKAVALAGQRVGPPIGRPQQIVCIGLNYADHAAESGMDVPDEPIVFTKAPNTLVGPDDDVFIPRGSTKTDWEVELGVVIGQRCRYLDDPAAAWEQIAGLVLVNDVSEREFQLERGGQWSKGKSCETFNPCGPWLLSRDAVGDVNALGMWLDVNGERMQTGSTATMIFDVAHVVWYLSQFMVLEPGDLINTGTPPGVGMGMNPPTFLQAGDTMSLGIDSLGSQHQRLVAAPKVG